MDDISDVGLVDAHTESDCRHDDVYLLMKEGVLVFASHRGLHPGMVGKRADIVDLQKLRHLLHLLSAEAIDDAAFAFVLLYEADDVGVDVFSLRSYFIIKIFSVET